MRPPSRRGPQSPKRVIKPLSGRPPRLGIGGRLPDFQITGVKPTFMQGEHKGECAFAPLTEDSFPDLWKVIFFYPKDVTFVCPAEIAEFARLAPEFADTKGSLTDGPGAREEGAGLACHAICIVDPHAVIGRLRDQAQLWPSPARPCACRWLRRRGWPSRPDTGGQQHFTQAPGPLWPGGLLLLGNAPKSPLRHVIMVRKAAKSAIQHLWRANDAASQHCAPEPGFL